MQWTRALMDRGSESGAGAVGQCAIALAHSLGAFVIATVRSDEDVERAKSAGADELFQTRSMSAGDLTTAILGLCPRGVDHIVEVAFHANIEADEPEAQALAEWTLVEEAAMRQKLGRHYTKKLDLGRWNAEMTFGRPMFGLDPPAGNKPSSGRVLIARLGTDEYLVAGHRARGTFYGSDKLKGKRTMILRVEEGHFDPDGRWIFERVWNGDQTDWGLNFTSERHILKVKMATY